MTAKLTNKTLKGRWLAAFSAILMLATAPAMALNSTRLGHINDSGAYVSSTAGVQNTIATMEIPNWSYDPIANKITSNGNHTKQLADALSAVYSINLGYQFGHYFGFESGLSFQKAPIKSDDNNIFVLSMGPKLTLPINNSNWNIFATSKLVLGYDTNGKRIGETGLETGIGLGYRVNKHLETTVQYQHMSSKYLIMDINDYYAQVGLVYHF
jgi:hypothetical protein